MNKKLTTILGACALCLGLGVVGTLAWLQDTTKTVQNTFTTSGIDITLTETNVNQDQTDNTNEYQMIPGYTIAKDPTVTVIAGSEKCYLFVEVIESDNLDTYIAYTIDSGWTELPNPYGTDNAVYYRTVDASSADDNISFGILTNDQVTVNSTVTNDDMDALNADGATFPTLSFQAYAIQYNDSATTNFTVSSAWETIKGKTE